MEEEIRAAALQFAETLRDSRAYKGYMHCAEALKAYPDVFERIMELRRQTVAMDSEEDDAPEQMEYLARCYEELQRIPEVNAFLEAEEDMVGLLKELNEALFTAVDLYLPEVF